MSFRRLSPSELISRGYTPTSRRYLNTETGADISYRQNRIIFEQSEKYAPLPLPKLARVRAKRQKYLDLIHGKQTELQSRRVAAVRTAGLTPEEEAKAIREAMKVSRAEIIKSPETKAQIKRLVELTAKSHKQRLTKAEVKEMHRVLIDLGRGDHDLDHYLLKPGARRGLRKAANYGRVDATGRSSRIAA